jgi:drug/metabolite transporter (DMT)-like permease
VDLEEKYAIALGVISLVLWAGSFVLGKALADAPGRVIRTVLPVVAVATLAGFFVFVAIARHNVHG